MSNFNMQQMMKQAKQMQDNMAKMQEELDVKEYEGKAGAGLVTITLTGKGKIQSLTIDPSLMSPSAEDIELMTDLIKAAFHDAKQKLDDGANSMMSGILPAGMKLPF